MDRRDFLRQAGLVSASFALSNRSNLRGQSTTPPRWRTFEITTRVEVLRPAGVTRIWLPTPLTIATPYQKPLGNTLTGEGGTTSTRTAAESANAIACFEFPEGVQPIAFRRTSHGVMRWPRDLCQLAQYALERFEVCTLEAVEVRRRPISQGGARRRGMARRGEPGASVRGHAE